jgi:hypothetical protein
MVAATKHRGATRIGTTRIVATHIVATRADPPRLGSSVTVRSNRVARTMACGRPDNRAGSVVPDRAATASAAEDIVWQRVQRRVARQTRLDIYQRTIPYWLAKPLHSICNR